MSFDSHHWSAPMTYFNSLVMYSPPHIYSFFFFNDTATTEIYTLSLHDALPILASERARQMRVLAAGLAAERRGEENRIRDRRGQDRRRQHEVSEDHARAGQRPGVARDFENAGADEHAQQRGVRLDGAEVAAEGGGKR